eukprot:731500-Rhodomonas_salina.1
MQFHRMVGAEYTPTKTLANGKPFGFDAKDDSLEVTLEGFMWSDAFSVEKSAELDDPPRMQRQQAIAVVSRPGDQGRAERARAARRVDKHRAPALRSHHDRHLRAAADHRELPGGGAGGVAARDRRPPPHQ